MNTFIAFFQVAGRRAATRTRRRMLLVSLLLAAACHGGPGGLSAQADSGVSKEYQVKAAFLFNFSMFAEWPASAFPQTNSPICVGILGTNPFGDALAQVVEGGSIKGRRLEIKAFRRVEDVKGCHLLFISGSEEAQIPKILSALAGAGVLTVGESEGFCTSGGIINLYLQDKKVRFEINPAAARQAGIRISAQLLHLGKIVGEDPAGKKP
jgi:hypothetical protein